MRLERAFLLEQLNKHMEYNVDDSDRSSSPPPTPTDKPLRSKRSHNRKGTPPPGGERIEGMGMQEQRLGLGHTAQGMNPMSSAQSTPDPSSRPQNSYFGTVGAAAATSPHAGVNGAPTLPPLHSLPQLQPQQPPTQRVYFDPAYDNERPTPASGDDDAGRRRAYSGAQQPAPPAPASNTEAAPQNGDTEMTDVSFTAVNR
jgi:hypothetical protein